MPQFEEVTPDVLVMAREIIGLYHEDLVSARIGFVFRDKTLSVAGKDRAAAISRVSPAMRAYLGSKRLDYIVWIAKEEWESMEDHQRRALIDHELCHARMGDNGWTIRGHDVEEFACIIERYGIYSWQIKQVAQAIQLHLPELQPEGGVMALSPAMAQRLPGDWRVALAHEPNAPTATLTYNGETVDFDDVEAAAGLIGKAAQHGLGLDGQEPTA